MDSPVVLGTSGESTIFLTKESLGGYYRYCFVARLDTRRAGRGHTAVEIGTSLNSVVSRRCEL